MFSLPNTQILDPNQTFSGALTNNFGAMNNALRTGIQNKYLPPELAAMVMQQQQKAAQMQAQTPYSGPQAAANLQQTQLANKWYPATQNSQIQNTLASAGLSTQEMNMLPAEIRNQLIQIAATHPTKFLALANKLVPGSQNAYNLLNTQINSLNNPEQIQIPGMNQPIQQSQGSTPFGNTNGMISSAPKKNNQNPNMNMKSSPLGNNGKLSEIKNNNVNYTDSQIKSFPFTNINGKNYHYDPSTGKIFSKG